MTRQRAPSFRCPMVPGEQALPVILATLDHNFALGIFFAGLPQKAHPTAGYGRFRFLNNPRIANWNTVKWNAVYREGSGAARAISTIAAT